MESIGARIKKLRLEKGLTLEEVHKKTKIHLNILRAIEEDKYAHISAVYLKGFLKIYCKFLGANPKDFILDYKEPKGMAHLKFEKEEKSLPMFKAASVKLISFKAIPIKIKAIFISILIIIFIVGLFNLGRLISLRRTSLKKAKLATPITAKTENKAKLTSAIQKPKVPTIIRLGIRSRGDCWIQLKTDGRVVFKNTLRKGSSESWQAKERVELSLGNAGVVDLEINGKTIPPLGRRGQVIKNILITKEGLSIPR